MHINFITKVGDCAYQAQHLLQTGPGDSPIATPTIALWNPDSGALPSDPRGLLAWIVGGGGAWLLAEVLLSEVLSRWHWFETSLSASGKKGVAVALAVLLSSLATWALSFPLDFWLEVDKIWPMLLVAAGLMGVGVNQATHAARKDRR